MMWGMCADRCMLRQVGILQVLFNGGLSMEDFKDLLPAVQIEILKTQR